MKRRSFLKGILAAMSLPLVPLAMKEEREPFMITLSGGSLYNPSDATVVIKNATLEENNGTWRVTRFIDATDVEYTLIDNHGNTFKPKPR